MKVVLIADVHSNIHALRAMEAAEAPFDLVICVGDLVDWGMDPKAAVDWLRQHPHVAVKGNHEGFVLSAADNQKRVREGLPPVEGTYYVEEEPLGQETNFSTYTVNRLTAEDIEFLRAMPESAVVEVDGYCYYLQHTCPESKRDIVLEAMAGYSSQPLFDRLWREYAGRPEISSCKRRIVNAHTHQCWMHQVRGGALFMNPGSISNRCHSADNLEPGADYIVIQDGVPQMKHITYPTDEIRQSIRDGHFTEQIRDIALRLFTPEEKRAL